MFSCSQFLGNICTYALNNDVIFNVYYETDAPGCKGTTACQFKTLRQAKKFCSFESTCTAILKHPGEGDCAGGSGCFTPGKGDLAQVDPKDWKNLGGITYEKFCRGKKTASW